MDERSDDDLLAATRAEPEAFAVFYRRHVSGLLGVLRPPHPRRGARRRPDRGDVRGSPPRRASAPSRERGPAIAWLYGIARRQLAHAARRGAVEDRARRRLGMAPLTLTDEALERVEALATADASAQLRRRRSDGAPARPARRRPRTRPRRAGLRRDRHPRPHVGVRRPQTRLARPRRPALTTGGPQMTDSSTTWRRELLAAARRLACRNRRFSCPRLLRLLVAAAAALAWLAVVALVPCAPRRTTGRSAEPPGANFAVSPSALAFAPGDLRTPRCPPAQACVPSRPRATLAVPRSSTGPVDRLPSAVVTAASHPWLAGGGLERGGWRGCRPSGGRRARARASRANDRSVRARARDRLRLRVTAPRGRGHAWSSRPHARGPPPRPGASRSPRSRAGQGLRRRGLKGGEPGPGPFPTKPARRSS